jgi:DNA adenine methylase
MRDAATKNIKPFLRWAGGKQWIAQRLAQLVPRNACSYFEPFLGGGSLFFAARPTQAILGDANSRLINTYRVLRDRPDDLISVLAQWKNEEDTYYAIRASEFDDRAAQAAQFVYLNKTCWNGLYRVNRLGRFNVPFGHNGRSVYDQTHLFETSRLLQSADLVCSDFTQLLKSATSGDFVYLDPPYTVLHSQNGFRRYNEKLFSWQDQVRLAQAASELAARGCLVVVSNADNGEVLDLYPGFFHQRVSRHSLLAASSKWRRKTHEALLVSSEHLLLDEIT